VKIDSASQVWVRIPHWVRQGMFDIAQAEGYGVHDLYVRVLTDFVQTWREQNPVTIIDVEEADGVPALGIRAAEERPDAVRALPQRSP
jgi:hypothetical protein